MVSLVAPIILGHLYHCVLYIFQALVMVTGYAVDNSAAEASSVVATPAADSATRVVFAAGEESDTATAGTDGVATAGAVSVVTVAAASVDCS